MTATNDFSPDEPIDAIVEEPNQYLAASADYPYGRPDRPAGYPSPSQHPGDGLAAVFHFQPPAAAQYMVPRRFGMSAILGIMTALALLFGGFRMLNCPPVIYLFFGLQTLVICFAQMLNGKSPRLASSIAGALLVPMFVPPLFAAEMRQWGGAKFGVLAILAALGVPLGAFLGYLTGTCAAGIFLVMDYLEPYLQGQRASSRSANVG